MHACAWIQSWLTQRTQSASSQPVSVLSGVPQGTVPAARPLNFLLYIATGIAI